MTYCRLAKNLPSLVDCSVNLFIKVVPGYELSLSDGFCLGIGKAISYTERKAFSGTTPAFNNFLNRYIYKYCRAKDCYC